MDKHVKPTVDFLYELLENPDENLKADWQEVSLEENFVLAGFIPEVCINKHVIGLNIGKPLHIDLKREGYSQRSAFLTGDLMITPANMLLSAHLEQNLDSVSLNLTNDLFERNALELWDIQDVELLPCFPVKDNLLQQLAQAIRHELAINPDDCPVYAQTMANAIAVHLLKNFSNRSHRVTYVSGTLPKPQLKVILDYINDNLAEKICLEDLAGLIECNQYYFSRAFKKSTGLSPHQYIIQQRIELAKKLLNQKKLSISEISLTCGFSHQSHLNRHFKRLVGTTPKVFQDA